MFPPTWITAAVIKLVCSTEKVVLPKVVCGVSQLNLGKVLSVIRKYKTILKNE